MKVAIVMPLAEQRGGAELLLLHLLRYRSDSNLEWGVIFLEPGPLVETVRALGVEVHEYRAGRLRNLVQWWRTVREINRIVRRGKYDLILGWMPKAQLYTGVAGLAARVPVVWYQHGMPKSTDWMDAAMIKLPARGIIACSGAAAEAQAGLSPKRPTRVVHPCFDPSIFRRNGAESPASLRQRLGLPDDRPVVGLVGRLQRWKGVHTLIQAMPSVLGSNPEVVCVIVGGRHELEPEYADYLDRLVQSLDLGHAVRLVGYQTNVHEWMSAMDVVVHASDREPFGMVIIEAMSLGKPVVAGAEGGPREILQDGHEGLLVGYEDAGGLSKAISFYLNNQSEARLMAERGRKRAADFRPQRFVREISAGLAELVRTQTK